MTEYKGSIYKMQVFRATVFNQLILCPSIMFKNYFTIAYIVFKDFITVIFLSTFIRRDVIVWTDRWRGGGLVYGGDLSCGFITRLCTYPARFSVLLAQRMTRDLHWSAIISLKCARPLNELWRNPSGTATALVHISPALWARKRKSEKKNISGVIHSFRRLSQTTFDMTTTTTNKYM